MRKEYPKEGTQLLPSRPDLEHHAHQSSVSFIALLLITSGAVPAYFMQKRCFFSISISLSMSGLLIMLIIEVIRKFYCSEG